MTKKFNAPLLTLISVFFFWGFIAASNTVLIGLFKKNFELSQFQSQLVEFAFYIAYFFGSLVYFIYSKFIGDPLAKIGYKNGLVIGLLISAVGALGFYAAGTAASFPMFLSAFFVIAIGFTLLQIVANPYVIAIGSPETGAHRVSLAGGLNSLGTMIAPLVFTVAIYGAVSESEKIEVQDNPAKVSIERTTNKSELVKTTLISKNEPGYILTSATDSIQTISNYGTVANKSGAIVLVGNDSTISQRVENLKKAFPKERTAILSISTNDPENLISELQGKEISVQYLGVDAVKTPSLILAGTFILFALIMAFSKLPSIASTSFEEGEFSFKKYPQIVWGMMAIFVYVGTEVTVQSNLPEYILQEVGLEASQASHFISLYWGSLMIGRWAGAISVFNVSRRMEKLLLGIVPVLAFGVIILSNWIKGSPINDLLLYTPFIALIILGFFMAQNKPAKTMILFGIGAAIMLSIGILLNGKTSVYFLVSGGLFCSVMWPCIFSLSIAGLGKHTSKGSSLLIMMILGGAIFPPMQGLLSDSLTIGTSYVLPIVGFLFLGYYGWKIKTVLQKQGINYDAKLN